MNSSAESIMPTSKESQAADLIPRDTLSPTPKPRNNHFFALPLELRTLIYEYYFSYEHPRKARAYSSSHANPSTRPTAATPGTEPPPPPRQKPKFQSILARKLPLLWSTKAILNEALPIFYQCHTFRVHVPLEKRYTYWEREAWWYSRTSRGPKRTCPSRLQEIGTLTPAGRFIMRLEIIERASVVMGAWDERAIPGLDSLFDNFPNLRFLRLNIGLNAWVWSQPPYVNVGSAAYAGGVMKEVWDHGLECLEICLFHYGDEGRLFRQAIAPAECWVQKTRSTYTGRGSVKVSVWSLRRSDLPRGSLT